ncbi:MAG: hypothetical protein H2172_06185 [Opitutus sp.]|nr:hypothetical protein [Opitutus sp.]MCS6247029.1 hypothetical protein [Opitutus sp.]MCS6278624.1 hypothetical protein [Opitutus sp.]MCS6298495.1 hypothetical protein [Opitutus sp.]
MKQNTPSWLANAFIYDGYSRSILDTNGDEIGMSYVHGLVHWEDGFNRTGSRAPMQWSSAKNAGFSVSGERESVYFWRLGMHFFFGGSSSP